QSPIGTPGQAPEESVGVVGVLQDLETIPGGWVPQSDSIIPPGTCPQASIGTPFHAVYNPAMATGHLRRAHLSPLHIAYSDRAIGACTGEPGAARTPGDIVEGSRVTLHDTQRLATLHLPHT